jgi:DNA-binding transcriptional MocR family regulator
VATITPLRLAELLGNWRGGGPAHERLAATLRALILDGRMPLEGQLPAERVLASSLGLSRTTVTAAYNQLRLEGYVASRQGSGSRIALPEGHRAAPDSLLPSGGLDMSVGALSAPPVVDELARLAADELPRWLAEPGYDPLGLPPLRRAIAERFAQRGLPTRPEQILVTNGAMQALDLAIRTVLRRGRPVIVESPTYRGALAAFRTVGARLRRIPVTTDGWDLETLAAAARSDRPEFAFLIPDFQNPTGALMDEASRRRALRALDSVGSCTVIDETFVELNLDHDPLPPAAAGGGPRVITIGSLSKAVWPGLRIGWARADPTLVRRLALARAGSDMASPVLEQLIAIRALQRIDDIMRERRQTVRLRRSALSEALDERLPTWRYAQPSGGLFIWAELPAMIATQLAVQARAEGLHITPGPLFGAAGLFERYLRLPFTLPPEQLARAVEILAALAPLDLKYPAGAELPFVA